MDDTTLTHNGMAPQPDDSRVVALRSLQFNLYLLRQHFEGALTLSNAEMRECFATSQTALDSLSPALADSGKGSTDNVNQAGDTASDIEPSPPAGCGLPCADLEQELFAVADRLRPILRQLQVTLRLGPDRSPAQVPFAGDRLSAVLLQSIESLQEVAAAGGSITVLIEKTVDGCVDVRATGVPHAADPPPTEANGTRVQDGEKSRIPSVLAPTMSNFSPLRRLVADMKGTSLSESHTERGIQLRIRFPLAATA